MATRIGLLVKPGVLTSKPSKTSSGQPWYPALYTRCCKVSSWVQPSLLATSGRKVALRLVLVPGSVNAALLTIYFCQSWQICPGRLNVSGSISTSCRAMQNGTARIASYCERLPLHPMLAIQREATQRHGSTSVPLNLMISPWVPTVQSDLSFAASKLCRNETVQLSFGSSSAVMAGKRRSWSALHSRGI